MLLLLVHVPAFTDTLGILQWRLHLISREGRDIDPDNGGSYWVEAFGVDIVQSDGPKATEVTCMYVRIQGNRQRIFPSGTSSMPRGCHRLTLTRWR